jgi:hypothetical protein
VIVRDTLHIAEAKWMRVIEFKQEDMFEIDNSYLIILFNGALFCAAFRETLNPHPATLGNHPAAKLRIIIWMKAAKPY